MQNHTMDISSRVVVFLLAVLSLLGLCLWSLGHDPTAGAVPKKDDDKTLLDASAVQETFCAGGASSSGRDGTISWDCDANRRDFTLGYRSDLLTPDACLSKSGISPQWTYWYYPNIMDHPCTDYSAEDAREARKPLRRCLTGCPPETDDPFGFHPYPPAPSDCPLIPTPPYDRAGEVRPTIPDPF